jgi:DMSO/TMAO reductase YedYZ molybdopterin-dependent catalytic subunit
MRRTNPLIVTLLVVGVVVVACTPNASPTKLEAVEIREYEGEKLSSIGDFRENSIKGPQYISLDDYRLKITGLVEKPLTLTYDEVLDRDQYNKAVTLYCVEGWDATILWEGVLIESLIDQAGVEDGAVTVIFHAEDGYTSSLPLEFVRENDILLAYKMNGVPLPPERGFPLQVVAESKWGYKWVKWVTQIELSNDPDYKGYWEERGYNNDGNLEGPIFER